MCSARAHAHSQTNALFAFFPTLYKRKWDSMRFLGQGWPLQSCSITLPHPIISHNFCANDAVTARSKLHCSYPASPARSTLECTRLAPCVVVALLDLGQLTPSVLWQVRFGIMFTTMAAFMMFLCCLLYTSADSALHTCSALLPATPKPPAAPAPDHTLRPPLAVRAPALGAPPVRWGGGSGYSNGSLQVRT